MTKAKKSFNLPAEKEKRSLAQCVHGKVLDPLVESPEGKMIAKKMPRIEDIEQIDRLKHLESDGFDGIWDWRLQEDFEYMSPRFWEILGQDYTTKKHHPDEWQDLIYTEDLTKAKDLLSKHIASKGEVPFLLEARYRHPNGSVIWVLCRGKVIEWDGDTPIRMIGTHTDITAIKDAQDKLDLKTKMFDALVNHTMDGYWQWEVGTDNDEISDRWFKTLGFEPGEFPNSYETWLELLHPDDKADAENALKKHIASSEIPYECVSRYRTKKGGYKFILDQGFAIRDDQGKAVWMIGTHTDIDKLKRTEARLTKKNNELSQFAYAASHDLQSPLRTISAFLEKIENSFDADSLTPKQSKWMGFCTKAARNLQVMISDMRSIATLDASQEKKVIKKESSLKAFKDACLNLSSEIADSKATITQGSLPLVRMPHLHQVQIMQNLISNAIKYSKPGLAPVIHIEGRVHGPDIIFSVSDDGEGIPIEMQGRIFSLFRRVNNKVPGKGVGLTLVKKIIESYDGSIWLESKEREGTTFYYTVKA